jgi:oxalyl-CoA decarboxylase
MDSPAMTDGFHLVVDALRLNAIDTIYCVAGIPITDLARLAQAEGLRYIGFRHEESAGNAAAVAGYLTKGSTDGRALAAQFSVDASRRVNT